MTEVKNRTITDIDIPFNSICKLVLKVVFANILIAAALWLPAMLVIGIFVGF